MGLPIDTATIFGYSDGNEIQVLPLRGYHLIWNEWFRDQNLQNPILINTGDFVDKPTAVFGFKIAYVESPQKVRNFLGASRVHLIIPLWMKQAKKHDVNRLGQNVFRSPDCRKGESSANG